MQQSRRGVQRVAKSNPFADFTKLNRPLQRSLAAIQGLMRPPKRLVLGFMLGVMLVMLTVGWAPAALGQLSLPNQSEQTNLPQGVQRLGAIETAPVRLENRELFRVVALTVSDRGNPEGRVPVEVRAETIEANLRQVIAFVPDADVDAGRSYVTAFDPETFRVETRTTNNQFVLVAVDDFRPEPQEILTVTDVDARFYRLTPEELARNWEGILEDRLTRILVARQPEVIRERQEEAIGTAVSVLV
ncbi:hypothetical protein C7B61_11845, partial [filamentous cyanobacterium CCP1]